MLPIDYTPPAAYARYYDARRYKLLIDESVRMLRKRFELAFVSQGVVYIKDATNSGSSATLVPLIEAAAGTMDDGALLDQVHRHMSTILYAVEAREGAAAKTYAQVKNKLTVRLYPEAQRSLLHDIVTRDTLAGVLVVLVLDDEGAFITVDEKTLADWGVSVEEAFKRAIGNAAKKRVTTKTLHPKTPSGTFPIHWIQEENHASGYGLGLLIHGSKYVGPYGALVSIPSRALVIATPLGPRSPPDICNAFVATTGGLARAEYRRHDRPVSTAAYWLSPLGQFTELAVTREGGRVWTEEPAGLSAMRE